MSLETRKTGTSTDGREMHYSAGIVVECKGKYLLVDRVKPPFGFACSAGHIDEGEDPHACALRELHEETGLKLEKLEFINEEEIPWDTCYSGTSVHYWYFFKAAVESEDGVAVNRESKSIGWFSPEEMKKLPLQNVWEYWFKKNGII
jgi:8-oxo-dGTP pyrophosphatase MutT (NUDIX family)